MLTINKSFADTELTVALEGRLVEELGYRGQDLVDLYLSREEYI